MRTSSPGWLSRYILANDRTKRLIVVHLRVTVVALFAAVRFRAAVNVVAHPAAAAAAPAMRYTANFIVRGRLSAEESSSCDPYTCFIINRD